MNTRLLVFLAASCLCGCETIPLLYLGEVALDVMDTHPRKPPWLGNKSTPPQESRQTLPRNQPDTPTGQTPAKAPNPSRTDASTPAQSRTTPTETPAGLAPPAPSTASSELPPPALPERAFAMNAATETLWKDYRAFQYEAVLRNAHAASMQPGLDTRQKAFVLMLAGSSAYILGDRSLAREILALAAGIAPDVRPNPDVFPGEVCRMYENSIPSNP